MNKVILILILSIMLSSCAFKRICYVAWGDAAISDTSVDDNSKKGLLDKR